MNNFYLILLFSLSLNSYAMNNSLPLLDSYSPDVQDNFKRRMTALGKDYVPRTQHLKADGSVKFVNALIFEESPYLLQHAHNPVNWHAWSPEAFELAKTQNKPIFISIGYATCHWCHVMEHESFENIEIAKYINSHFIAIKIDRERRSAIDSYYMTGVQMMTGHGGWPMSNFTLADGKPFFGGTYYPAKQFLTLLTRVHEVWQTQGAEINKQAIQMDQAINKYLSQAMQAQSIKQDSYTLVNQQLQGMFDEFHGGFSAAPKFPQEPWLLYLLSQQQESTDTMLTITLDKMQQGGIYDQVGGGFHRYATDGEWLIPHFEKMLYNQSQLTEVYTLAALKFNNPEYKRTALAIIDYVLNEMMAKESLFFSAGDADSDGEEGLFFTWTINELKKILSNEELLWLQQIYHFTKNGNFEGRNILFLSESLAATAKKLQASDTDFLKKLDAINKKLYQHRALRNSPLIDNKVISSWNAQMIYSLALAAGAFDQQKYLQTAVKTMQTLMKSHVNDKGYLVRNSLNGKASVINAELEDYAWMITAGLKLYDLTGDEQWLRHAKTFIDHVDDLFADAEGKGFFDNRPEDNIPMDKRIKQSEDGATVSANGQMLIALARYYRRTGDLDIDEKLTQSLAFFSGKIVKSPASHTSMLRAKSIYEKGDMGQLVYAANGKVKISSQKKGEHIIIAFAVQDGWHINSDQVNIESLIPLQIKTKDKHTFIFPKAQHRKLDFIDAELSTFAGDFTVSTSIDESSLLPILLTIKLQACSNKICLAPSEVKLQVYESSD
jgi:uncharacterized protein YyaL (SSP411 family)